MELKKTGNNQQKAILITGASSGIGFEFAHVLCEQSDLSLILVARRKERLENLKNILLEKSLKRGLNNREIIICSLDLKDQTARNELLTRCSHFVVDTLINNAGYGSYGEFQLTDIDKELGMIRLNCEALVHLTRLFLPQMIKSRSGTIINVSSMASFQGLPWLATYAATKSFVTSFSLGLAAELNGSGVQIQALCPGPVATEFIEVSGFPEKISVIPSISARAVAEHSISRLKSRKRIVIPGAMNYLLAQLNRFVPRALASEIARSVLSSKFNK
ncbi:MAG TPA: SDR family oxidoreductase [Oligoflexia bacterium]|nr:SDR family oxidoreductase [Oligoflexia bacterium]HMP48683.1 SDR family oxidoreductase [Oligoflexia bacterium]